jgi:hypothetical protein
VNSRRTRFNANRLKNQIAKELHKNPKYLKGADQRGAKTLIGELIELCTPRQMTEPPSGSIFKLRFLRSLLFDSSNRRKSCKSR